MSLLDVRDLTVIYRAGNKSVQALNRVSFSLERGEALGVVGESGCGKSTLAKAILALLPRNAQVISGSAVLDGAKLYEAGAEELQRLRWTALAYVTQSAMDFAQSCSAHPGSIHSRDRAALTATMMSGRGHRANSWITQPGIDDGFGFPAYHECGGDEKRDTNARWNHDPPRRAGKTGQIGLIKNLAPTEHASMQSKKTEARFGQYRPAELKAKQLR